MSTLPRVSVVLPVYNAGAPLCDALDSLLAQTYTDFEIVAVDDGSTDGSAAVLDGYAARDPRVRVMHQENSRQVAAMNRAIAEARGEYVARMDADDRSYPERFARQVAYLDAHPKVGVLGTLADVSFADHEAVWGTDPGNSLHRWRLLSNTPFVHPSVMMRTDLVRSVGGYAPDSERLEDYDMFYRLSRLTQLDTLPEKLVWYNRVGESNISTVHFAAQQRVARGLHGDIFSSYGMTPRAADLDDYSRFAFEETPVLAEPGWTPSRLAAVARLLWALTLRFINEEEISKRDRGFVLDRTYRSVVALSRRHGEITGHPALSKARRLAWTPRLSMWSLSGRRVFS